MISSRKHTYNSLIEILESKNVLVKTKDQILKEFGGFDSLGYINFPGTDVCMNQEMLKYCGRILTLSSDKQIHGKNYFKVLENPYSWIPEMIEKIVQ